jgi:hypothetical protein
MILILLWVTLFSKVNAEGIIYYFEEFYLLGYKTVYYIKSQVTFRMKMSPPFSVLKSKPGKKPA